MLIACKGDIWFDTVKAYSSSVVTYVCLLCVASTINMEYTSHTTIIAIGEAECSIASAF